MRRHIWMSSSHPCPIRNEICGARWRFPLQPHGQAEPGQFEHFIPDNRPQTCPTPKNAVTYLARIQPTSCFWSCKRIHHRIGRRRIINRREKGGVPLIRGKDHALPTCAHRLPGRLSPTPSASTSRRFYTSPVVTLWTNTSTRTPARWTDAKGTVSHSKQTSLTQTTSLTLFNKCTRAAFSKTVS